MLINRIIIGSTFILAFTTGSGWAHSPIFTCFFSEGAVISCEGAFSDGSNAAGTAIEVKDAHGNLLSSGKLDFTGSIELKKPAVDDFTILFDGGPGHQLQVRSSDILH
ncbi:MAG: hypothetical protein JXR59_02325 [Desulfuromonadaceae bacterium]|nr:hypothetical protein [Desulfuromonadaceae bacterium]